MLGFKKMSPQFSSHVNLHTMYRIALIGGGVATTPRSQLLGERETNFQRLPHVLGVNNPMDWNEWCTIKPEMGNPLWRPPNLSTIISAFRQDRIEISTNVFRVQLSHGIGCVADRPNRKWEIQNGDLKISTLPPSWIFHFRFGRKLLQLLPLDS